MPHIKDKDMEILSTAFTSGLATMLTFCMLVEDGPRVAIAISSCTAVGFMALAIALVV